MKPEKPILFVWDFHGVLEKDNELAVHEVTNRVLGEFGYEEKASIDDIHMMYGLPWGRILQTPGPRHRGRARKGDGQTLQGARAASRQKTL